VPGERIRLFILAVDWKWALCLPSSLVSPISPISLLSIFLLFGKNFDDVGKVKSGLGWVCVWRLGDSFRPSTVIEADGIRGDVFRVDISKFY